MRMVTASAAAFCSGWIVQSPIMDALLVLGLDGRTRAMSTSRFAGSISMLHSSRATLRIFFVAVCVEQ